MRSRSKPDLPSSAAPDKTLDLLVRLTERVEALTLESRELKARVRQLEGENRALAAQNAVLASENAKLREKLDLPPKTPDNSSTPPSKGQKESAAETRKPKANPHEGAHRPLHPNPTGRRDFRATQCQHCQSDVSGVAQAALEAYDHVEIPEIKPQVTRVTLLGGRCPCCTGRFKALPPQDMPPGSPFGPNLRAFVLYLRFGQAIPFARPAQLMSDLFGLTISEGALANLMQTAAPAFAKQTSLIKARLLEGTILQSTRRAPGSASRPIGSGPSITRTVPASSSTRTAARRWSRTSSASGGRILGLRPSRRAARLGDARSPILPGAPHPRGDLCDRGGRRCLCAWPAPALEGRLRHRPEASAAERQHAEGLCGQARLPPGQTHASDAAEPGGLQAAKGHPKVRRHLFVFVTNRDLPATNNGSERALRMCVVFRKVTNCFRSAWGAAFYADIRSVMETARRRSIDTLSAIRLTLQGLPLPVRQKISKCRPEQLRNNRSDT